MTRLAAVTTIFTVLGVGAWISAVVALLRAWDLHTAVLKEIGSNISVDMELQHVQSLCTIFGSGSAITGTLFLGFAAMLALTPRGRLNP